MSSAVRQVLYGFDAKKEKQDDAVNIDNIYTDVSKMIDRCYGK